MIRRTRPADRGRLLLRAAAGCLCICPLFVTPQVLAQEPPGQRDTPLDLPDPAERPEVEEEAPAGAPARVLPPAPTDDEGDRLVTLQGVMVRKIVVRDAQLLSAREIAAATRPYEGRVVSIDELQQLRYRLSLVYFDKGYVNSGVLLPDQRITDGTIYFDEVRGTLNAVELEGNRRLNDHYILARVERPEAGEALQINELQSSLQLLEQNPVIRRIDAQLVPGMRPGESSLRMSVEENSRWQFVSGVDNHRSPAIGGEQATFLVRNHSLSGNGDRLDLFLSFAEGLGDGYLSYSIPINARNTTVSVYGAYSESDIVENNFDDIDIESDITTAGILLTHPFHRSLTGNFSGFFGFEHKHTENRLLGDGFSFSPGEDDGETDLSVFQTGIEFSRLSPERVMAMRFTIRRGLRIFGATEAPDSGPAAGTPDGQFTSLLWQSQYIRNLNWRDSRLFLRGSAQRAPDPVLSPEKMPVGGVNTVRGYRENLFVRDNGVAASIEWQVPLFETGIGPRKAFDPLRLSLATFFDYGASWDNDDDQPTSDTKNLYSVGLGLLWDPSNKTHSQVYWGYGLKDFDEEGNDMQDDGFHFRVSHSF